MSKFNSSNRYMTKGIEEALPLYTIIILWELVDRRKQHTEMDYLQIFTLKSENGIQRIIHEQEQPTPFKDEYTFMFPHIIDEKIYIIDDGDHETMLLASEY